MGRFMTFLWYSHCFACAVALVPITLIAVLVVLSVLPINKNWLARVLPPRPVPAEPRFRSRRRNEPPQRPYVDLCRAPYGSAGVRFSMPLLEAQRGLGKQDVRTDA